MTTTFVASLSILCMLSTSTSSIAARPNFVIFLADDLGYGDVGSFGNDTIQTFNIDRIAAEGVKLTHHLTAAAVCTPSRAALLTGRYPVRSGMESTFLNKVFLFMAQSGGLPENETTFARILQDEGYETALIGKWHLGVNCNKQGDLCHHPLKHGFHHFYGLPLTNLKDFGADGSSVVTSFIPHFYGYMIAIFIIGCTTALMVHKWSIPVCLLILLLFCGIPLLTVIFVCNLKLINGIIMRNQDVVEQPIRLTNLTQRFTLEAKEFLYQQANLNKPFFLFMPFVHVHTALFSSPEFVGVSAAGRYGDNVEELDWAVGEILHTLEKLEVKNNTFVYFSSDNGAHVEETGPDGTREGGYNGIFKGGKGMGGMEGGIRVPTVVMFPGRIPAGLEINTPTSQMDLFPTILNLANKTLPTDLLIDGKNMMPLLTEQKVTRIHTFLFHYCGSWIHAARYIPDTGNDIWKVHYTTPNWVRETQHCPFMCQCFGSYVTHHNPPLLYNIATDPGENTPLDPTTSSRYAEIVSIINDAVEKHKLSVQTVPDQFSFVNAVWKPWLQPCCSYYACHCNDPKYSS
ncbi:steryl-sulfatase-like isoform X2 [Limulus polyphemus]|uniref:Steryl-sulfatase-like isoform X2 n=1 Tax=Limulus polyphemus TaxID=6850 RepID=A0ABM1BP37_LIMPO|nr:steryl-sulfatase-like isoform X2 [Limulus polyphemus]